MICAACERKFDQGEGDYCSSCNEELCSDCWDIEHPDCEEFNKET